MCLQHNLHVFEKKMQWFLINNQNIATDLQLNHPGSRQLMSLFPLKTPSPVSTIWLMINPQCAGP